ncbi:graves disease carrier protein homolog isoform X3 [Oncorhynchus mykiss]|uniref:graves disease carrier protein homolog isoform X3 n=1 Tax=Oncorhynchus mykiss TaxID=8022 RepID=UPI001878F78A|nr:graves disease carrier protein homolog isoform X3 [Oncorhynchus mykiss]
MQSHPWSSCDPRPHSGGLSLCPLLRSWRVKILLQANSPHDKDLGVVATLRVVPREEGYLGLYKGNGAMMVRIFPYRAIQFMAFDKYKKILSKQLGVSGHIHRPVVGAMAGMTAVICTYPLDVIRACLAYQMKGHHRYTGIRNAFQTIYLKEGGIPGFYKGLIPTLIGMTPYAGFLFITFSTLRTSQRYWDDRPQTTQRCWCCRPTSTCSVEGVAGAVHRPYMP